MERQWWIASTLTNEKVTAEEIKVRDFWFDEVAEMPEADQEHFSQLLSIRDYLTRKAEES